MNYVNIPLDCTVFRGFTPLHPKSPNQFDPLCWYLQVKWKKKHHYWQLWQWEGSRCDRRTFPLHGRLGWKILITNQSFHSSLTALSIVKLLKYVFCSLVLFQPTFCWYFWRSSLLEMIISWWWTASANVLIFYFSLLFIARKLSHWFLIFVILCVFSEFVSLFCLKQYFTSPPPLCTNAIECWTSTKPLTTTLPGRLCQERSLVLPKGGNFQWHDLVCSRRRGGICNYVLKSWHWYWALTLVNHLRTFHS